MSVLLKNAKLVSSKEIVQKDVLIEDCYIRKIAGGVSIKADHEYDLTGKYLIPGAIDTHVHLRSPGFEEKEDFLTGSMAALAGGVTTVFDMPNTNPSTFTLDGLNRKRELAQANSLVNFGLFFGAKKGNLDEVKKAPGIVGIKVYMGETTATGEIDDSSLDLLFKSLFTDLNHTVAVHAEDEKMIKEREKIYKDQNDPSIHSLIRNDVSSYDAAKRAVHLAKKYNGRLHLCHIGTKREAHLMEKYPDENITCEVSPHHLFLTTADYAKMGNFVKVNPPLRAQNDVSALWSGLLSGTIDSIATDHAPHLKSEKEKDYWQAPAGVPGLETMLPLLLNAVNEGKLRLEDVVRLVCENPARIYRIKNKGTIREGFDADLTVVDMEKLREVENGKLYTKCGWSPFAGHKLRGWPVMTFVRGQLGMKDGKIIKEVKPREVEVG